MRQRPSAWRGSATPTGRPSGTRRWAAAPCAPAIRRAADGVRSLDPHAGHDIAGGVEHVHPASHARVERMDRPQDLERLIGLYQGVVVHERRLVRSGHALAVTGRTVPGTWHDALIARDLLVLDLHPVAERATWRVEVAVALCLGGPRGRVPLVPIEGLGIAALDTIDELVVPV